MYLNFGICLAAALLLVLPGATTADIAFDGFDHEVQGRVFTAIVTGEIQAHDRAQFDKRVFEAEAADTRLVILDSPGGDIHAAMEMGRMVRQLDFTAVIIPDATCSSACVLLLASGVERNVRGRVGIHRPFIRSRGDIPIGEALRQAKSAMETYLDRMNIPVRLVDDMFSIDPGDIRFLSESELRDYRLNSTDFVRREEWSVDRFDRYGLSREAYEVFRRDLNYTCQIFMHDRERILDCFSDVARRHDVILPPDFGQPG